jgi:hypothetical protein
MCAGDLVVSGRYAYVNRWERAISHAEFLDIRVIDVSDPDSPTEVGLIEGVGRIAAVADGYGYTFDPNVGIWVLDLTDPASPTEVGFLASEQGYGTVGLAVSGNHAYVAAGEGCWHGGYLRVVDVSDPAEPIQVAVIQVISDWSAQKVAISGHYAYVACGGGMGCPLGYVTVVDVSNPAEPAVVAQSDDIGWPTEVAVAGRLLYVTSSNCEGEYYLHVFDVTNPADLVEVESLCEGVYFRLGDDVFPYFFSFSDVCLCGRYVYTISEDGDFVVFNSWDCTHPWHQQMPLAVE